MARLVFTTNGVEVHLPDPSADPDFHTRGDLSGISRFKGRIPILYSEKNRQAFLGGPDWYHHDTSSHHGLNTFTDDYREGYVAGGPDWNGGNLAWYSEPPTDHQEIAQSLIQAGIPVPNAEAGVSHYQAYHGDDDAWEDDPQPNLDFWHP